jgi:ArsR family transcriptional regulator
MGARSLEAALSVPVSEVKAELFKALGHPARIRVLEVLSEGEHSVGEMQPLVGIESSHLSPAARDPAAGWSRDHPQGGASVIYSLADPLLAELLAVAKRLLIASLVQTEDLLADLRAAAR